MESSEIVEAINMVEDHVTELEKKIDAVKESLDAATAACIMMYAMQHSHENGADVHELAVGIMNGALGLASHFDKVRKDIAALRESEAENEIQRD